MDKSFDWFFLKIARKWSWHIYGCQRPFFRHLLVWHCTRHYFLWDENMRYWCVWNLLLRLLRAFALLTVSLGSQLLKILRIFSLLDLFATIMEVRWFCTPCWNIFFNMLSLPWKEESFDMKKSFHSSVGRKRNSLSAKACAMRAQTKRIVHVEKPAKWIEKYNAGIHNQSEI